MAIVPYIECDADGSNSARALCSDSGVKGYPTWQLDGQLFPGASMRRPVTLVTPVTPVALVTPGCVDAPPMLTVMDM